MTLAQTALLTRRIILFGGIILTLSLVSFIGYKIWYASYSSSLPPVVEKPDTKFGVLPYPDLPKSSTPSGSLSYSLDTATGNLPKTDSLIKIYFMPKPYTSFGSPDKANQLAKNLKIDASAQIVSDTLYKYSQDEKKLEVNIDSGNFTFTQTASASANPTAVDSDEKLVADFKSLLSSLNTLPNELKNGPTKVSHSGQNATISLWPQDLDDEHILSSSTDQSKISATVVSSAGDIKNYQSINYTFWPIDITTFATYPNKGANQAFDDLKNNLGVVLVSPGQKAVSITNVYLAFYQPDNYTPYLQQIFVFEGPGFTAYVPAVSSQFLQQK